MLLSIDHSLDLETKQRDNFKHLELHSTKYHDTSVYPLHVWFAVWCYRLQAQIIHLIGRNCWTAHALNPESCAPSFWVLLSNIDTALNALLKVCAFFSDQMFHINNMTTIFQPDL